MKIGTMVLEWILTIALSIVAPIVVYGVATDHGVAELPALLLSGIGPVVEMAIVWLIRRRLDEVGIVVITFLVVSIVVALATRDARALLLRESVAIGLYGVFLLATVPTRWPMCFLFGRRFVTGGDPEKVVWWNGLWQYPRFRRTQRQMTTMWGATFVVESVVRGILVYQLPVATMVVINSTVPFVIIAVLVTITIIWGKREQALGEARERAAAAEAAQAPA